MKTVAVNKKANFDYLITDKFEAGLVLTGSEVKSLRNSSVSIKESYIGNKNSELWLFNCHIGEYKYSSKNNYNPTRNRKILVKKKEKYKIISYVEKDNFTAIPIILYFTRKGLAKLQIGIGKGKKKYDKRQSLKKKEWNIEKKRLIKNNQ